jgi:hypothetical protein
LLSGEKQKSLIRAQWHSITPYGTGSKFYPFKRITTPEEFLKLNKNYYPPAHKNKELVRSHPTS